MKEPDVFNMDCDLISEKEEYAFCNECYRYETCKSWWERNKESGTIRTAMDGLTYFVKE